jgi:hypothetical protein
MSLISGSAIFNDGSVNCSSNPNIITGPALFVGSAINCGDISSGYFSNPDAVNCGSIQVAQFSSGSTNCAVVSCASFFDNSSNVGTISLTAAFSGTSVNSGTALNASFVGAASNIGVITSVATFAGSSSNVGTVSGSASFADTTVNSGTASSASFVGSASNVGNVTGAATFSGTSINCGGVTTASFFGSSSNSPYGEIGTATFADTAVNSGAIGTGFFVGSASNAGTVDTIAFFDDSTSNVGIINCAYFSGTSSNAGIICCASFSESTTNLGTICTSAEFIGSASNAGVVLGNADFGSGTCNAGSVSGTVYAASGAVICLALTYVDITGHNARIGAYDLIANGSGQCFTGNLNYVNSGALIYDDLTCCSYVSNGTGYYISYYRTGTCLTNQACFEVISGEQYPCGFVNIYSNGLGSCYCLTNFPVITCQPQDVYANESDPFCLSMVASGSNLNYSWYTNSGVQLIDADGWTGTCTNTVCCDSAPIAESFNYFYGVVENEAGGVRSCVAQVFVYEDIFTDASIDAEYNITPYSYTTHGGLFYQDGVPYTGTHNVTDYEIQSDEYGPCSYTTTSRNIGFENGVEFLANHGSFTSDQNYISVSNSIPIGTGDFTFEGFLKPNQLKSSPFDTSFINGVGYQSPALYIHWDFSMHFGPNGVGATITSTAGDVELNKWHHVAIVRENGLLSIYINGVRKNTASDSFNYGNYNFYLSNANSNYGFVGSMAYIRISNNARYSGASLSIPIASFTSDANTLQLALNSATLGSGLTNHGVTLVGIS